MIRTRLTLAITLAATLLSLGCHEVHLDFDSAGDVIRVFDDLYSDDSLSLWVVDPVGRTSPYYSVDGKSYRSATARYKRTPRRPVVDQIFRPLPALDR